MEGREDEKKGVDWRKRLVYTKEEKEIVLDGKKK